MNQPVEGVDARTDRFAQGAVGVALLAAFVFRVPLLVPVNNPSSLDGPSSNADDGIGAGLLTSLGESGADRFVAPFLVPLLMLHDLTMRARPPCGPSDEACEARLRSAEFHSRDWRNVYPPP